MDRSIAPSRLRESVRYDGIFWRKIAGLGAVHGPEWVRRYGPGVTASIIFLLVRRVRTGAVMNMRRVFDGVDHQRPARAALEMFIQFAQCMTETLEYYGPQPRPVRFDPPPIDPLAAALQDGRGAILLTGHLGNWDIAAKTLQIYRRPVNVVMKREENVTAESHARRNREHAGVRMVQSDASVFSSLDLIRALQRNEIVAMQLDRTAVPGRAQLVPFFGAPASFPLGPFVLARLAGAPLIPAFVPRIAPRHYAIRVGRAFTLPRSRRDTASLGQVVADVVRVFEETVREFPTQWFQFSPFWPSDVHADHPKGAQRSPQVERVGTSETGDAAVSMQSGGG